MSRSNDVYYEELTNLESILKDLKAERKNCDVLITFLKIVITVAIGISAGSFLKGYDGVLYSLSFILVLLSVLNILSLKSDIRILDDSIEHTESRLSSYKN